MPPSCFSIAITQMLYPMLLYTLGDPFHQGFPPGSSKALNMIRDKSLFKISLFFIHFYHLLLIYETLHLFPC